MLHAMHCVVHISQLPYECYERVILDSIIILQCASYLRCLKVLVFTFVFISHLHIMPLRLCHLHP